MPELHIDDEAKRVFRPDRGEEYGAIPMTPCPINITNDMTPGGQLKRMYDENTGREYRVILVEYDPLKCSLCGLGPHCCSEERSNEPGRCCRYLTVHRDGRKTAWDISANLASTQEHLVGLEQSAREWKSKCEHLEKEREEIARAIGRYRFKVRDLLDELSRESGLGIKKRVFEELGLLTPEEMGVSPEYAFEHSMDIFNRLGEHTRIERAALEKIERRGSSLEGLKVRRSQKGKADGKTDGKIEGNEELLKIAVAAAKKTIGFELTPINDNLLKNAWSAEDKQKDWTRDEDDE